MKVFILALAAFAYWLWATRYLGRVFLDDTAYPDSDPEPEEVLMAYALAACTGWLCAPSMVAWRIVREPLYRIAARTVEARKRERQP